MSRTPIHSDAAPAAIGPYSQATRAGNTVYLSGQTPLVQVWMNSYLEQSRKLFAQMQEQMLKQAGMLFPGLPPKG